MANMTLRRRTAMRGAGSAIDWESIARGMVDLTTEFAVTAEVFGNSTQIIERQFANRKITSVVVPSTITTLGSNAFNSCTKLTHITYEGSNITTTGTYVFAYCSSIVNTIDVLPSSLTSINTALFNYCSGLRRVDLPSNLTTIGASAFQYANNIEEVNIPASVTSLGANAFLGASRDGMVLTCLATSPPACGNANTLNTNITAIYVPDASVNDYKAAQYWSTYASIIKGISERPTT